VAAARRPPRSTPWWSSRVREDPADHLRHAAVLLRPSMRFSAWVAGDRPRGTKVLGVKPAPFGSAMITSIGMFGIPLGFAPLSRFNKMPLLVLVGRAYMENPAAFEPDPPPRDDREP
jgi:hypothetical protein